MPTIRKRPSRSGWVDDHRSTGETPNLEWLVEIIDETQAHRIA
jgi:hypothetical protein